MSVKTLPAPAVVDAWRSGPAVALGVGLIALGLVFRVEVVNAVRVWDSSTAYNHCFLVIPIVLYLIWDRRDALRGAVAEPYPLAAAAGVPLAIGWLLAERLGIMEGRQLAAVSFAQVLFFLVLGPRLWWRLAGPLLYLYFLVPFGAFLTPQLQDVTTVFVIHGLPLLHIPAYVTGYTIEIPEGTFLVAEACAGLRFLIASFAFGCLYALLMYRSPVRRGIFIIVSLIVPIIANGFRALGIVALGHYLGSAQAVEADHVLYGWIFFSIVILILIALGLPFRQDHVVATPPPPPPPHTVVPFRGAIATLVALIVLAAIGPAAAAQLNRAATLDLAAEFPLLVPSGGCVSLPVPLTAGLGGQGRLLVQRFDCGAGVVTLTMEVFSPRSTAARLVAEQRRLVPTLSDEDAEMRSLEAPGVPSGTWRMVESTTAPTVAATSLWMDGRPAHIGLTARAKQAWRSIFGGGARPVLLVASAESDWLLPGPVARREAASRVAGFLQTQPALPDLVARLAAGTN
ncbi:MAG: exosortase A [Acetobacteraceae bacterium]